MNKAIVILAGAGASTNIVYNALSAEFEIISVIIEKPIPRTEFLKRRIKRLGLLKVIGQVLFQLVRVFYLERRSRRRIRELKETFKLNDSPVGANRIINVASVNSDETITILKDINPPVVVVNGTRIISDQVLKCIPGKFINIHAGITPLYRGTHGAYWALVEKNKAACGVTAHLVDSGIDTGHILGQAIIEPTEEDNFTTYPLLQLAAGIPLLKKAVNDLFEDRIEIKPYPEGRSRLWSHPTLFEYLRYRLAHGVK